MGKKSVWVKRESGCKERKVKKKVERVKWVKRGWECEDKKERVKNGVWVKKDSVRKG